jgi:hypothetical protein
MTKERIAVALFHMKRDGQELAEIGDELYSTDELLSMLFGHEIEPAQGQEFILNQHA